MQSRSFEDRLPLYQGSAAAAEEEEKIRGDQDSRLITDESVIAKEIGRR
jgi:hypothetical protein